MNDFKSYLFNTRDYFIDDESLVEILAIEYCQSDKSIDEVSKARNWEEICRSLPRQNLNIKIHPTFFTHEAVKKYYLYIRMGHWRIFQDQKQRRNLS